MIRGKWQALEVRVAELEQEILQLPGPRPVLRGSAIPGNGWVEYDVVFQAEADRSDVAEIIAVFPRGRPLDSARLDALLAKHAPAIDHLRKGTRYERVQAPVTMQSDLGTFVYYPDTTLALLILESRRLRGRQASREASDLLLDLAQCSNDLGRHRDRYAQRLAMEMVNHVFLELLDLLQSGELNAADLKELGRQLEILDANFVRPGSTFLAHSYALGTNILKGDFSPYDFSDGDPALRDWKHLFSERLMLCDAFEYWDRWNRRLAHVADLSPDETEADCRRADAEAQESRNPVVSALFRNRGLWCGYGSGTLVRERHAQLRLLRMIAGYRATGEIPDLDDPFGGKMRHRRIGKKLRIWSVGSDRKDDGGDGAWEPREIYRDEKSLTVKDIVAETER